MTEQESLNLFNMLKDDGTFELALAILEEQGEEIMEWLYSVQDVCVKPSGSPFWEEYHSRRLYDLARGTYDRR